LKNFPRGHKPSKPLWQLAQTTAEVSKAKAVRVDLWPDRAGKIAK
jgi:hypothetical protein